MTLHEQSPKTQHSREFARVMQLFLNLCSVCIRAYLVSLARVSILPWRHREELLQLRLRLDSRQRRVNFLSA